VGYHTLSDFRSHSGEKLSDLITQVLALLMSKDLVDLTRVAQDGTRIAKAHRGLSHLVVRGQDKVLSCTVLFALTYAVLRLITLGG
jgi:hypothetical protein